MCKTGIFAWFSYHMPLEQRLRLIKQAGFDAVSLWWGNEDKRPELARKIGLEIDNVHAPFDKSDALWMDRLAGQDQQHMLMDCIRDCGAHQIPTAVIHLTSQAQPLGVTDVGLKRIAKIVETAERHQVKLAFENLAAFETLDAVLAKFDSPFVGFCYDIGHEHCNHPHVDALAHYGNRLFAVHLHDNCGDADAHLLPFDGTIDWPLNMQKLRQCKTIDYLTLEVDFCWGHATSQHYAGLPAQEFLQLAYDRNQQLIHLFGGTIKE